MNDCHHPETRCIRLLGGVYCWCRTCGALKGLAGADVWTFASESKREPVKLRPKPIRTKWIRG